MNFQATVDFEGSSTGGSGDGLLGNDSGGKPSRARSNHNCTVLCCSVRHYDKTVMQATRFGEASSEAHLLRGGILGPAYSGSPQALSLTDTEPTATLNRVSTLT